jgi:hypothetical protein
MSVAEYESQISLRGEPLQLQCLNLGTAVE